MPRGINSKFYTKKGLEARSHPTSFDIVWAAGIYEGEGSFVDNGLCRITQKDDWLVLKLRDLFGGTISRRVGGMKNDEYCEWSITGSRARGFVMTIYKFLSLRRQERIKYILRNPKPSNGMNYYIRHPFHRRRPSEDSDEVFI